MPVRKDEPFASGSITSINGKQTPARGRPRKLLRSLQPATKSDQNGMNMAMATETGDGSAHASAQGSTPTTPTVAAQQALVNSATQRLVSAIPALKNVTTVAPTEDAHSTLESMTQSPIDGASMPKSVILTAISQHSQAGRRALTNNSSSGSLQSSSSEDTADDDQMSIDADQSILTNNSASLNNATINSSVLASVNDPTAQRKAVHLASEKRRRQNISQAFTLLRNTTNTAIDGMMLRDRLMAVLPEGDSKASILRKANLCIGALMDELRIARQLIASCTRCQTAYKQQLGTTRRTGLMTISTNNFTGVTLPSKSSSSLDNGSTYNSFRQLQQQAEDMDLQDEEEELEDDLVMSAATLSSLKRGSFQK